MNKIGIIVGGIALALSAYLFFSLSTLQNKYDTLNANITENTKQDSLRLTTKPELPNLIIDESNLPIAYVNRDVLMAKYKLVAEITKKLDLEYKKSERELMASEKKLMSDLQDLQDKAQSGMIKTQAEYEAAGKLLQDKEQRLMTRKQQLSEKLIARERKLTEKLGENISTYLKKYSSEFHYSYIITTGSMSNVLYASDSLNITDQIVKGLNAEYTMSTAKKQTTDH